MPLNVVNHPVDICELSEEIRKFKLSSEESEYLQELVAQNHAIASLLTFPAGADGRKTTLVMSDTNIEKFARFPNHPTGCGWVQQRLFSE